jgi:hypothetical protein
VINEDHLNLARKILTTGQRGHDLVAVPKDQPISPIHIVPIELNRFALQPWLRPSDPNYKKSVSENAAIFLLTSPGRRC